jgi:hypothetical protein
VISLNELPKAGTTDDKTQPADWLTATGWLATVSVPDRGVVAEGIIETLYSTTPLPDTASGGETVIQLSPGCAIQAQPVVVVTAMLPLAPAGPTVMVAGVTEYEQVPLLGTNIVTKASEEPPS